MKQEQLNYLSDIVKDLPRVLDRLGRDGKEIEAFYLDFLDTFKEAKKVEEKMALINIFTSLMIELVKALQGFKNALKNIFKFLPFISDPLKEFRAKALEIAKEMEFKRYLKLRE